MPITLVATNGCSKFQVLALNFCCLSHGSSVWLVCNGGKSVDVINSVSQKASYSNLLYVLYVCVENWPHCQTIEGVRLTHVVVHSRDEKPVTRKARSQIV